MNMKDQRFGIEVELTGITREAAAKVAAEYFGTSATMMALITIPIRHLTAKGGRGSL